MFFKDADVRAHLSPHSRDSNRWIRDGQQQTVGFTLAVFGGGEIYIAATGVVDKEKEKARLTKELQKLEVSKNRGQATLDNKDFVQRAPAQEVERIRAMIAETQQKING